MLPCAGAPSPPCSDASDRCTEAAYGRGGLASRATPPPASPPSAACQHNGRGQTRTGKRTPRA
eukprot:6048494-Alexandrium_andersonii.AAC.1